MIIAWLLVAWLLVSHLQRLRMRALMLRRAGRIIKVVCESVIM
jgi:hypothetical protein